MDEAANGLTEGEKGQRSIGVMSIKATKNL